MLDVLIRDEEKRTKKIKANERARKWEDINRRREAKKKNPLDVSYSDSLKEKAKQEEEKLKRKLARSEIEQVRDLFVPLPTASTKKPATTTTRGRGGARGGRGGARAARRQEIPDMPHSHIWGRSHRENTLPTVQTDRVTGRVTGTIINAPYIKRYPPMPREEMMYLIRKAKKEGLNALSDEEEN